MFKLGHDISGCVVTVSSIQVVLGDKSQMNGL